MIQAAVIGLGWWGRQIVSSLEDSDRIKVTLGVDVDAKSAEPYCRDHGIPFAGAYDAALSDPAIDAVILVTPHGLHEQQVLAAVDSKKHVFCEKPLALSAKSAARMLEACDAKGLVIGIGHERRFEGALEEAKRMVDAGEIGTLLHIEINWSHNLFAGKTASGWRQDSSQAPAGTLTALGIHMTDYMISIAGSPQRVFAQTADRSVDYPGDDIIAIQLQFASGVTGYLCNIATTPFHQTIKLFGDRGWIEVMDTTNVDKPDPAIFKWRGMDEEIHQRTFRHTNAVRANLEAWADAVEGRQEYRFSHQELLENVQLLEAIVTSASTQMPQTMNG